MRAALSLSPPLHASAALAATSKRLLLIRCTVPGLTPNRCAILRTALSASRLVSGVDIVTISKRLGHAKPSVTLAIYAHMFTSDDSKAAAAINAAR
jgi:integrase